MKQFGKILNFELQAYFKNKIFVGVTLFLVLLLAIVMFFPRLETLFASDDSTEDSADSLPVMLVKPYDPAQEDLVQSIFSQAFPGYQVQITDEAADSIAAKITSEQAECAFVMTAPSAYTYYVDNFSMHDMNFDVASGVIRQIYQMNMLDQAGMSPQQITDVLGVEITGEAKSLGKSQMDTFFYTYIMIFALYMVILLYGQMVATNVASEKSSRAMEVLITSAKPTAMMFGKVIASCLAGLLQIVAVFGSALLFYQLNQQYWRDSMIINSLFNIPPNLFAFMLVFFVLGFFIYAFLYGSVGSTASKLEDINTSVLPITILFLIAFIVVSTSITSGRVDNILLKILF